jgi:tetratricopeptide (TPR) repeat protein
MKKVLQIAVILLAVPCVSVRPYGGEEIPLRQQIDGLAPEPRIAYLEYLLRTNGPDPEVYFHLGVAYHEQELLDSALVYYGKAVEIDPAFSRALVNMGVIYDDRGRHNQALASFERAAAANPGDVLAHSHASYIRFLRNDYRSAWRHLSEALASDPDHPQARFYLAIFFWESGMYREALREWERVIELEPDGYLAARAQENIILLQKELNVPGGNRNEKPKR